MNRKKIALAAAALVLTVTGTASNTEASGNPAPTPVAPHILEQARQLTGRTLPHGADRPVPVASFSDGCNHNYGGPTQCLPKRAAGNKPLTCAYLKAEGWLKHPVTVHIDSAHLVTKPGSTHAC